MIVGIVSSAVPFLLWAYAALSVTAGLLSVLNATSPMWGALCSAVLLRERLNARRIIGLAVGVVGVVLVTQPASQPDLHYAAIVAALGRRLLLRADRHLHQALGERRAFARHGRGLAARRRHPAHSVHRALAAARRADAGRDAASILALGLVCSALAYLLYFRLIADIGATGALTVTYLIPVFGVLWGVLFLGEDRIEARCSRAPRW